VKSGITTVAPALSDALVFFGATGDLAHKKVLPALQAMAKRGHLSMPVIGVAKAGWNLDQLRARAKDSVETHGGLDAAAFDKLSSLLRYVDGDYQDPATFYLLRSALGSAQRPLHYLAIPPSLSSTVVGQLGRSGCAKGGRVVAEKPFGRDLASAPFMASPRRRSYAAISTPTPRVAMSSTSWPTMASPGAVFLVPAMFTLLAKRAGPSEDEGEAKAATLRAVEARGPPAGSKARASC
jgi:hypothetical protein